MTRAQKVHKDLNFKDLNFLFGANLLISFLGSIFLAMNGVTAGTVYALIFLGGMGVITLLHFWLKDDRKLRPISDYMKVPIATSLNVAAFVYVIGMVIPYFLNLIITSVSSYSVTSFAVPLFGNQIIGGQTFATASIGASMPWKIFNIMFVAGNMETFAYSFVAPVVGVFAGIVVLMLVNKGKIQDLGFINKKTFILGVAMLVSTGFFVVSHVLNGSYGLTQFIVAGFFILISNISIYWGGFFLSFWAGYHQSNNLIYLMQTEGLVAVLNGFISLFGVIFIIYMLLILFFLISNWDNVKKDLAAMFRALFTF